MQEEFTVAGVAGDRRFGHRYADQSYLSGRAGRFLDDARLHGRIANDALLADFRASGLELRLHERDDVGAVRKQRRHARKDVAQRDERHVDGDDVDRARAGRDGSSVRAFARSMTTTRGSLRRPQSSWP